MKKIVFYSSTAIAAFYLVVVVKTFVFDYNSLNSYGLGNLLGKAIILAVAFIISFFTGNAHWKKWLGAKH